MVPLVRKMNALSLWQTDTSHVSFPKPASLHLSEVVPGPAPREIRNLCWSESVLRTATLSQFVSLSLQNPLCHGDHLTTWASRETPTPLQRMEILAHSTCC